MMLEVSLHSKTSYVSERPKEQSPTRMFGISESLLQSSEDGDDVLQTFTPSFPAHPSIYTFRYTRVFFLHS